MQETITTNDNLSLIREFKLINPRVENLCKKQKREFPNDKRSQAILTELIILNDSLITKCSYRMKKKLYDKSYEIEDCKQEVLQVLKGLLLWMDETVDRKMYGKYPTLHLPFYLNMYVSSKITELNKKYQYAKNRSVHTVDIQDNELNILYDMTFDAKQNSKEAPVHYHNKVRFHNESEVENKYVSTIEQTEFLKSLSEIEQKIFQMVMSKVEPKKIYGRKIGLGIGRTKFEKTLNSICKKAKSLKGNIA